MERTPVRMRFPFRGPPSVLLIRCGIMSSSTTGLNEKMPSRAFDATAWAPEAKDSVLAA